MSEKTGAILQHAEEEKYGQSRAYTPGEVNALIKLTIFLGSVGIVVGILVGGTVGQFWRALGFTRGLLAGAAIGAMLGALPALRKAVNEQIDGLRSYETRKAQTYAPPSESMQLPSPWHPPVIARYQGGTTLIDMNDRPMLPDPQQARQITPPLVAEILRASIEQYDGQWSRRKLMRLRIAGQKVSRGLYEELTSALHQCGLLQQTRQGGFELPHDVESFEDLQRYLPSLPSLGGMGGGPGRDGNGGDEREPQSPDRGYNLAERHRLARLTDLDHSVRCYLQRKEGSHD